MTRRVRETGTGMNASYANLPLARRDGPLADTDRNGKSWFWQFNPFGEKIAQFAPICRLTAWNIYGTKERIGNTGWDKVVA